jgi:hypothetical protein
MDINEKENFEIGKYYIKCHNIYYDQEWLVHLVGKLKDYVWVRGRSVHNLHYPVHEFHNLPQENIIRDLYEGVQFNFRGKPQATSPSIFLSRIDPGGLNLHQDHRRWGALLFPIVGDFEATPQVFAAHDGVEVERFYFSKSKYHENYTPVFFNSRANHTVIFPKEMKGSRYILIVNIHSPPSEMFSMAINGKWLRENTANLGIRNG